MQNLTKKLRALGNERRLNIMKQLLGYKKLAVGDISEKIDLSFRSTSRHLKILESADFINWKQVGKNIYYFISSKAQKEFLDLVKKFS